MSVDMTQHTYQGDYKSAIARAKRILLAAGFPWSKTTGRYSPFADTKRTSHGVRVTRVGCSTTIALHAYLGRYAERGHTKLIEACAIATLREGGLPFDDRGFLDCTGGDTW